MSSERRCACDWSVLKGPPYDWHKEAIESQHEIERLRDERDDLKARVMYWCRPPFLLSGDIAKLGKERDALKARVEELEDGFFGRMAALLRTERDQLRADALAHMELAGQLRARVTELETREKWLENQWECATKGWVTDSEALRAKLAEANRLLRMALCAADDELTSHIRAHLAKEGEEPAKKVIRRADTPESMAFWAHAEGSTWTCGAGCGASWEAHQHGWDADGPYVACPTGMAERSKK